MKGKLKKQQLFPELNLDKPVIKGDYLPPSKIKNAKDAALRWQQRAKLSSDIQIPKTYIKTSIAKQNSSIQQSVIDEDLEKTDFSAPPILRPKSQSERNFAWNDKSSEFGSRFSLPTIPDSTSDYRDNFGSK